MATASPELLTLGAARIAGAGAVFAFGFNKLLAQLLLGVWVIGSAGQSDIAARGPWILAAFLPEFSLFTILLTALVVTRLARRAGPLVWIRLALGVAAGSFGALAICFGADPSPYVLGLLPWASSLQYHAVSAVVATLLVVLGCSAATLPKRLE